MWFPNMTDIEMYLLEDSLAAEIAARFDHFQGILENNQIVFWQWRNGDILLQAFGNEVQKRVPSFSSISGETSAQLFFEDLENDTGSILKRIIFVNNGTTVENRSIGLPWVAEKWQDEDRRTCRGNQLWTTAVWSSRDHPCCWWWNWIQRKQNSSKPRTSGRASNRRWRHQPHWGTFSWSRDKQWTAFLIKKFCVKYGHMWVS